ncbi:putative competence-damage inducible protein [Paucilactobacillus hokkaidonensis JCM 18461]|uniref:Putative competence-damage inducible protein n=2 Tax=Paucilactobacillus hokkaidonensis TaxID=1193095 RepID=A0A0A1GYK9_9LACO|nr:competence/damage-inducible protein A [Paucilactobacillus hokkaidonensis]KRO10534.1 competence damage-inducible protein A [Paucilactobacillus hokkaidonensis]BAP86053.1 putative competence-damage inducible protein [Paucilactobacillus hokkaidonensis JCM 18461]
MNSEIVTVGTELLLGRIDNTNARFIADQLAQLGIESHFQTVVGDNEDRIVAVLNQAATRSDLIIICGGLGPTVDDMTLASVSKYLGLNLQVDETQFSQIKAHFNRQHRSMTPENVKQAQFLAGAKILPNDVGLALGDFVKTVKGPDIAVLPGPPSEMETMFINHLVPLLEETYPVQQHLISRVLRFYGISESMLMHQLNDVVISNTNPSIASYAKNHEILIRLTAQGKDDDQINQLLDITQTQILAKVDGYFYGTGSKNSLAKEVVMQLKQKGLTVTAAESLTGGLFQSTICSIAGASKVFDGGFVTYANQAKKDLLHINAQIIDDNGVVSKQTAIAMASQARKIMNTDIGISFTGVAGPDQLEGHPAGTVWIGLSFGDQQVKTQLEQYLQTDSRQSIREKSVLTGLQMILQMVK